MYYTVYINVLYCMVYSMYVLSNILIPTFYYYIQYSWQQMTRTYKAPIIRMQADRVMKWLYYERKIHPGLQCWVFLLLS